MSSGRTPFPSWGSSPTRFADSLGGHPQLEPDRAQALEHLRTVFDLAERHDVELDLHCDESDDPGCHYVLDVASETVRRGWQGRVAAAHLSTLELLDQSTRERALDAIAEAGITVVCNPTSNLMFRGRGADHPRPRGLPPVAELTGRGVRVCLGQENYKSFFISTLRHPDPALTAHVFAYGAQQKSPAQMPGIWRMVTTDPAALLGLPSGLAPGQPATFNVFPTPDVTSTLAAVPPRRWVVHAGRLVSSTTVQTWSALPAGVPA